MRRALTLVLFAICTITLVTSARANGPSRDNWWTNFWSSVHRDYHRNNCWPEPFVSADRAASVAPFGPMIRRGWEHQNLLSDHHFEADSKTLSQAGQLKVHWILTQAPAQYRSVYLQRGTTADVTATRLDTVQRAAATILPAGELPQVVLSGMEDPGHPAEYIDSVGRKFHATTPDPRLPKAASGGEAAQ